MWSAPTRVLVTTVSQSEISTMALPITAATSTAPLLHPTTRPWFLLRNASTIIDWHSEHWTEYRMHILKEVVMIAQHRRFCCREMGSWGDPD